jgi:hypothetical protein
MTYVERATFVMMVAALVLAAALWVRSLSF